jgi:hypothetical protein
MKLNVTIFGVLAASALLALAPAASAGSVTFAQTLGGGQNFNFVDNGPGGTLTGTLQVDFFYEGINGVNTNEQLATLTVDLSTTQGCGATCNTSNLQEGGFAGTFSILLNTPVDGMDNLLSGTITDTAGGGVLSGTGGAAALSVSGADVNFTSDFISFEPSSFENLTFGFSSVTPGLTSDGEGSVASFTAAGTGTFASNPAPFVATPEPASMLLIGAGLIALGSFGRKRLSGRR